MTKGVRPEDKFIGEYVYCNKYEYITFWYRTRMCWVKDNEESDKQENV